jgi:hypothetical protein
MVFSLSRPWRMPSRAGPLEGKLVEAVAFE